MRVSDQQSSTDVSERYEWISALAESAVSVTNDAGSARPPAAAAAASEANDPANAVVLVTSSWPLVTAGPDVNSSSSYCDAEEPVTLQYTAYPLDYETTDHIS